MKILIVDDEIIIRALLVDVLRNDGHEADAEPNGVEALNRFREKGYDLIFSDVHMPEMNGYELLKRVREQYPGVFVVMMDSYPEELSEKCLRDGAFYCVHKPFDITELREVIRRVQSEKQKKDVT
jgi:two-component system, response regulator, stage 0 sporulation protein F